MWIWVQTRTSLSSKESTVNSPEEEETLREPERIFFFYFFWGEATGSRLRKKGCWMWMQTRTTL